MADKRPKSVAVTTRIPTELSDRIDDLAARMSVNRNELMNRIIRNGTDELAGIVEKCENPIINLCMKIAVNLAADETERQDILDQLNAIAEQRRARNQDQLPGIAS